ncbi:MAG: hypothetical protein ISS15_21215 [Alphaproteobacteria bacterium]|nr:hypothetical protein [Reyranella sp.]MBL6940100.1 hypothetical protein [Alphaproteobacteria bacterium]MBL7100187.1 hypothetical protein [Alphaproteobacteria bacterium]
MVYPLTVNRLMGLCAFESTGRKRAGTTAPDPQVVADRFFEQMELISREDLGPIYCKVHDKAKALGIAFDDATDFDDLPVSIVQKPEMFDDEDQTRLFPASAYSADLSKQPRNEPTVGLFGSKRVRAKIGDAHWDIRIRPSVTACVLEGQNRRSKIWWTIEGVPVDKQNSPTAADSVTFIKKTTKVAELALQELRAAYIKALKQVDEKERGPERFGDAQLRVSFADNTDSDFLHLVDAMTLTRLTFNDALTGSAAKAVRAGAGEVERFIRKTAAMPDPLNVKLKVGNGGTAAVFSEAMLDVSAPPNINRWVISGLASSIGMVSSNLPTDPRWMRFAAMPDLARSVSAARPLSARIADNGARQLEIVRAPQPAA